MMQLLDGKGLARQLKEELAQLNQPKNIKPVQPVSLYPETSSLQSPIEKQPPTIQSPVDPSQMSNVEALLHRQLQIMEQQLALLGGVATSTTLARSPSP